MDRPTSVLIWNSFNISARSGGPPTYLYNLNESWNSNKDKKYILEFINSNSIKRPSLNRNKFSRSGWRVIRVFKFILSSWLSTFLNKPPQKKYDIVHFHLAMDVYLNKRWLKKSSSLIVLTPHSPELAAIEIVTDIYKLKKNSFWAKLAIYILTKRERRAFKFVNQFVFPCVEARETYLSDPVIKKIITKSGACKYALTCSPEPIIKTSAKDIRSKLNIPIDAKVICYAGRHNHVKGFDRFVKASSQILKKDKDIFIMALGSPGIIKSLEHDRWIEVGWTDTPHDYMNAADIFVLPNRSTYFDLIFLESLSLGNFIVASYTGGNKFFEKFFSKDIILYDDKTGLEDSLLCAIGLIEKVKNNIGIFKSEVNYNIYNSHFSIPNFYKYFNNIYKKIK